MDYIPPYVQGGTWQTADSNGNIDAPPTYVEIGNTFAYTVPQPKVSNARSAAKARIPRPPNAFMLFANENRRKVAKQFPQESNKEISCRLGNQWKSLSIDQKDKYFTMAKAADAEHKKKYPDYVYNPKEARIRKALRERERNLVNAGVLPTGQSAGEGGGQRGARGRSLQWMTPGPPCTPTGSMGPMSPMGQVPAHFRQPPFQPFPAHQQIMRSCKGDGREMMGMGMESGNEYMFPGSSYQQNTHPGLPTYIHLPPNDWITNSYIQNNTALHQQFWNQYHTDRIKAHQKSLGRNYIIQPEEPQYLQVEHFPPNLPPEPLPSPHPKSQATPSGPLDYLPPPGHSPMTCSSQSEINTPTNVMDVAASCEETYHYVTGAQDYVTAPHQTVEPVNLIAENAPIDGNVEYVAYEKENSKQNGKQCTSVGDNDSSLKAINMINNSSRTIQPKPVGKSLPGFNQAFGSTERGRYQSAPEPISLNLDDFPTYNIKLEQYSEVVDQANSIETQPMLFAKDFAKMPF